MSMYESELEGRVDELEAEVERLEREVERLREALECIATAKTMEDYEYRYLALAALKETK